MIKDPAHEKEHFKIVNALLKKATPLQAFQLGVVSARLMAERKEIAPDIVLFQDAMNARSPAEADLLVDKWLRGNQA